MAAYVIYQAEVLDSERYEVYKTAAAESIRRAGGRYIVRGGDVDVLEGDAPAGRTVVVEFPDRGTALEWYRGETYGEARKLREGAALARMYVVDGVGPEAERGQGNGRLSCLRRCDVEGFRLYDSTRRRHLVDGRAGEPFDVQGAHRQSGCSRGRLHRQLETSDAARRPAHG